ncbi:MAG TPA: carboxypeptidase regulatory-like domain-containing protein, partial [Verrucomicrobiae bacterium]|nr:carboxypeptidase regulatory-like domain-containing protein [Verrucomicrobiae bacterium]
MVRHNGHVLEGATVSLTPPQRKVISGADGAFSFSGIPIGVYMLEVTSAGYLPYKMPVTVDSLGSGVLTIELKENASSLNEVV